MHLRQMERRAYDTQHFYVSSFANSVHILRMPFVCFSFIDSMRRGLCKRQNKTKTNSHSEFRRKRFQFELLRLRASWQLVVGLFWPKNFQLQREAISDLIDWFYNSSDSEPHLFFARCDVRMGHRLVMSSQLTARILIDLKLAATPIYKFNNNANYMSFPSPVSW